MGRKATGPSRLRIAGSPIQNMRTKELFLILLVLIFASPALAQDRGASDKESARLIPLSATAAVPGYDAVKKALDADDQKPTLKERTVQLIEDVKEAVESLRAAHTDKELDPDKIHLNKYVDSRRLDQGDTIQMTYIYEPSRKNPYDTVRVVYDSVTLKPISATAYKTTELDPAVALDLSGMTVYSTAYYADGSLAVQSYRSEPTESGAVTQITLYYTLSASGSLLTSVEETLIQPLDLKKVRAPRLKA